MVASAAGLRTCDTIGAKTRAHGRYKGQQFLVLRLGLREWGEAEEPGRNRWE